MKMLLKEILLEMLHMFDVCLCLTESAKEVGLQPDSLTGLHRHGDVCELRNRPTQ